MLFTAQLFDMTYLKRETIWTSFLSNRDQDFDMFCIRMKNLYKNAIKALSVLSNFKKSEKFFPGRKSGKMDKSIFKTVNKKPFLA